VAGEPAGKGLGLLPSEVGERDIAATGVPPGPGPLRLAVAHEPDLVLGIALAPDGIGHNALSGRIVSSGVAAKNSRGFQPKAHASGSVGRVEILVLYR